MVRPPRVRAGRALRRVERTRTNQTKAAKDRERTSEDRDQPRSSSVLSCSQGTPAFPLLRWTALRSSIRSSMSSRRSCNRRISAANDSSVGFLSVVALPISLLPILDSIHADQIVFQREEDAQASHSQPIFMRLCGKLFHISRKIDLQGIKPSTKVAPLFFRQSFELFARLLFDL